MTRILALTLAACALPIWPAPAAAEPRPTLPVFESAAAVDQACEHGLADTERTIATLATAPATGLLARFDALFARTEDFSGGIELAAAVAPDGAVRDAADACNVRVAALFNSLFQNTRLYRRIARLTPADGPERELRRNLIEGFEDAGATLADGKRQRARAIRDRLDALAVEFQKNTREKRSTVTMAPTELAGLPDSYRQQHQPDAQGNYVLSMDYTDYFPFMDNATSADARRRYYVAFNQVGGDENLRILGEAVRLRRELAGVFGLPSYAHYAIQRRMAGTPERVRQFLDQVRAKVAGAEARDVEILRQAKAEQTATPLDQVRIDPWDVRYYQEQVRRQRHAIDQEALRRYFPTEASVAWVLDLAERLYGVRFVAAEVPRWHADVRYYDVFDNRGQRIAGAYLDLYPRPGKYSHAAVWPVRHGSTLTGRTPIAALVANLDRQGLNHDELETLLHEFGHLLHTDLSRTRYALLSGTNVRQDFVEAPSQMFEEWARRAQSLALLRDHCADCPAVDAPLLQRLDQARRFGAGIRYARQHRLASFDMALTSAKPGEPLAVWQELERNSPFGTVAETRFPAQFGHLLGGYAAGYYSYMWAEVIALDLVAQWHGNLMDPVQGRRYLDTILSRGGETPPERLVRDFLGRAPSPEPFFAEITGARGG